MIEYSDFEKIDVRVGKIIDVENFPEARKPAYKIKIDFGEETGIKKSSIQITKTYKKKELLGKQVVGVINFPPKQVANFVSEVLTLGVDDENGNCILLTPDKDAKIGVKMY